MANRRHTIQRGETLSEIAERYQVSQQLIQSANQLASYDVLRVGQTLVIPVM